LSLSVPAETLQACWQAAEQLQVATVVVEVDDAPPPADWPQAQQVLADWGTAAAERGLRLALHVPNTLLPDARAMSRAMQALEPAPVRLCFDTGGYLFCNPGANGEVALQRVLGWVGALVLRDVEPVDNWGPNLARPFPPPGQGGEVDFARSKQLAASVAFSGPALVAFDPPPVRGAPPAQREEAVRRELQHTARLLGLCGWLDP
jgi:sugar phosphate isomerase/epimerase